MTKKYKIVFTGKFKDGTNHGLVIEHIATAFRVDKASIKNAIENKSIVKHNIDQSTAEKYWEKLNQLGVICKIYNEDYEVPIEPLDHNTNKGNEALRNENKRSSGDNQGTDSVDNICNTGYIDTLLKQKVKILSAFITVIIVMFLAISFYKAYLTEEGRLKRRHAEYISAHRNYDTDKAYSLLTPLSRKNLDIKDWEKKVLSVAPDTYERINAISFHDKKSRAVIGVELEQDGRVEKRYTQTWIFAEGEWYRAYHEDKLEENKTSTTIKFTTGKKSGNLEEIKSTPSFILQEYKYHWDVSDSNLSSRRLFRPEIQFRVKSNGEEPITYLRFKVQFYEKSKNRIFSEKEAYAIGSDDISLKKDMLSQVYFIKSDIGFDISTLIGIAIDNQLYKDAVINKVKELADEIHPSIYYKLEPSSEWIEYSL